MQMPLYLYDIKYRNKRDFDRTKRVFYYNLQKLGLTPTNWVTKSAIIVPEPQERQLDMFFKTFKKRAKNIVVYKVFLHHIEEIE